MLACVATDTFRYRRLHPAFVLGGLLLVGNDYLATWAAGTSAWASFTVWLTAPLA